MSLLALSTRQGVEKARPCSGAIIQTLPFICPLHAALKFPLFFKKKNLNQGCSPKWFTFAHKKGEKEYFKHLERLSAEEVKAKSLTRTPQPGLKITYLLVFHQLCLTRVTFLLGADGEHWRGASAKLGGVITHRRKMRPLTGSGGKKKHKAPCSSPPSSEECTHCRLVPSRGTPHPCTFIFNPWPLPHLETQLNSNTRKLSFSLRSKRLWRTL